MVARAVSKLDEVHALLVRIADERALSVPRRSLDDDLSGRVAAAKAHERTTAT